jgi:ABC-type multidrug transport system fused ATPase/permease subunit
MGAIIDIVMQKLDHKSIEALKEEDQSNQSFIKKCLVKTGSLSSLFGVLTIVFVIGAAANAGRQMLMAVASGRVITRMRSVLFSSLMHKDIKFHDINRSGELISRLATDTAIVGGSLTQNIADGLRSLVMTLAGVTAMLYVNVDLTAATMVIIPFVSGVAVFYGRFVRKLAKQTTDASAELTKFAEEKISNIRTVRAFSKEQTEIANYDKNSNVVYDLGIKEGFASSLFFSTMGFSGNIVILGILYYGGSLVQLGHISIGELTSFFLYTIYGNYKLIKSEAL